MPRGLDENLAWRQDIQSQCRRDPEFAASLAGLCAEDPLFYVNAFAWTYDPRLDEPIVPFLTFDQQEDALLRMQAAFGKRDILIEKSRDEGATWLMLALFHWAFTFGHNQTYLLASRNEDLVEKGGDKDCLFWKFDLLTEFLPPFLRPRVFRKHMHRLNLGNGTTVDGCATTSDIARGGRRRAVGIDEFAAFDLAMGHEVIGSTQAVTNCRIFNSTHQGLHTAYYETSQNPSVEKVQLLWWRDPRKNAGLYTSEGDQLVTLGHGELPAGHEAVLDEKTRSPWYDRECGRLNHIAALIAQELDCNPAGAAYQFFEESVDLAKYEAEVCREPDAVGTLGCDELCAEPLGFTASKRGDLALWMPLDDGRPPAGTQIVLFADISAGTGSSNSAISGYDTKTRAKVLQWVNPHVAPEKMAPFAVALARWCHNAWLGWESNNHGRPFGKTVLSFGYSNIYYRRDEARKAGRITDFPGWYSTKDTKRELLTEYRRQLAAREVKNLSRFAVDECRQYIHLPDGDIVHSGSVKPQDPTKARHSHGDVVISDAGCCWMMRQRPHLEVPVAAEVPINCMMARRMARVQDERDERRRREGWL